jgi:HEPN domain-containing protein
VTKEDYIEYWIKSSEKDLETMMYLMKGNKYVHALFFGHLYVEKISKALWVKDNEGNFPPKIHNLLAILKHVKNILNEDQQLFLLKLNQYQIEGRYPEDIDKLYKITDKKLATEYIDKIKSVAKCLLSELP